MRTSAILAIVVGAVIGVSVVASVAKAPADSRVEAAEPMPVPAEPKSSHKLPEAYEKWRAAHEENGGDRNVSVVLRWHKALSSERTAARGKAHLDLVEGSVSINLEGLSELGAVDVWLVDNLDGESRSVKPEPGNRFLYAGAVEPGVAGRGTSTKFIGAELRDFEVDLVVVTRKDASPAETGVLFGSLPLFQRLYSLDRIRKIHS